METPLSRATTALSSALAVGPFEIPRLAIVDLPFESPKSILACLFSPSTSTVGSSTLTVPTITLIDRPLEIGITNDSCQVICGEGSAFSRTVDAHAVITLAIETGPPRASISGPVSMRPSGGGWIARALIRPVSWSGAAFVTVESFALGGRSLPCDCLPATLRVGYNHSPALPGAVFAAARNGDVIALQAALDADGSTEEANEVRATRARCCWGGRVYAPGDFHGTARSLLCSTGAQHCSGPRLAVTLAPSVYSLRQEPMLPLPPG